MLRTTIYVIADDEYLTFNFQELAPRNWTSVPLDRPLALHTRSTPEIIAGLPIELQILMQSADRHRELSHVIIAPDCLARLYFNTRDDISDAVVAATLEALRQDLENTQQYRVSVIS